MTSLSNHTAQEFEPLKLETLESFDDEQYNRGNETAPDLDRFKVLYEPKKLVEEDPDIFEFLYDYKKEVLKEDHDFIATFTGLNIRKADSKDNPKKEKRVSPPVPEGQGKPREDTQKKPRPEKTDPGVDTRPERSNPGVDTGFEKGFEQGRSQGYDKGFNEGMAAGQAQGEKQGLEKGEKTGFDIGVSKGEKDAMQRVEKDTKELFDALNSALEKSDQIYDNLLDTYEKKILELVLVIAEKIIFEKIRINDEVVRFAVIDAMKHLADPEKIVLSVSPEDYAYIEMVKESFFEDISSLKNISVISDTSIHRGGCRIKTATGTISSDPKAKLDAIVDSMAKVRNQ